MRVKQRNVCDTCRIRKLGCDGKLPECSQCAFARRKCSYPKTWAFVSQTYEKPMSKPTSSGLSKTKAHLKRTNVGCTSLSSYGMHRSVDDLTTLICQGYLPGQHSDTDGGRICGGWIQVLPDLVRKDAKLDVLSTATTALALSMTCPGTRSSKIETESYGSYESALRIVRNSLATRGHRLDLVLAIMCLALVEMMFPSYGLAMTAHITAVGELLRSYGPNSFQTGASHELFYGFRPLLVLEAFRRRQPTFLALKSWIEIPFSQKPQSLMQALLTEVVSIPSLLHMNDALFQDLTIVNIDDVDTAFHAIIESLGRLRQYERHLWFKNNTPCFYTDGPDMPLRFPNITMANCFTHIWAFRIVCLVELEKFSQSFPSLNGKGPETSNIQAQTAQLSKMIALSMDYLLGDDMKLFGPASTFFPLSVAYQVLLVTKHRGLVMEHIDRSISRLVQKGLRSAPFFVKCDI